MNMGGQPAPLLKIPFGYFKNRNRGILVRGPGPASQSPAVPRLRVSPDWGERKRRGFLWRREIQGKKKKRRLQKRSEQHTYSSDGAAISVACISADDSAFSVQVRYDVGCQKGKGGANLVLSNDLEINNGRRKSE